LSCFISAKKILIAYLCLSFFLAIGIPFSLAEELKAIEDSQREKAMAMALELKEAEKKLTERQPSWKIDEEKKIKESKSPFYLQGYYKNLLVNSKTTDTDQGLFYDLNRLRLDCRLDLTETLQFKAVFDQEALFNDFSQDIDFQAVRSRNQKHTALLDGDYIYADNKHIYSKFSLYRGYFKYSGERIQAVFGKQLVDWGRCRFWSPMDLFNPVNPTDIEKDERIGVDALNTEFSLSPQTNLNFVYAPRRTFATSSLGMKLFHQVGEFDLILIGGEFKKDEVFGFGFDGYLGNGSIRGEFTQTHANKGRDYFRGTIGGEYSFSNRVHVLAEYFFNGGANDSDPTAFITSYNYASDVLTLKKNLLGLLVDYEVTPLIKWDNYVIYDFDGKSVFFNPEVRYNIWKNFDLSVGMQLFWGNSNSEFGDYQNTYYLQGKLFF